MSADPKKALLERLFTEQGGRLRVFFGRRARRQPDVADLVQEVYLRMLRVDIESLENPQAYLYTVAANLFKEYAVRERAAEQAVNVDDPAAQEALAEAPAFGAHIDAEVRIKRLREVLRDLPPKWHAAVVLAYWYGMTYEAIAERLDVSPHMVKKYLSHALVKCRLRMARLG
jgi:RNA polymerase sigma-70 factor (ECF subfamily)